MADKVSMTIGSIAQSALLESSTRVQSAAQQVRRASAPVEDITAVAATEQVELSDAAVSLLQAQRQYETSLKLAKTADEIAQSSIDLLA
ncbi:MAG: hypothetical protein GC160_26495 [Acidobacteria bacterium]|nr:hypothetical protein [Acidobacteriota bacterium]